ncbi:heme-degrading domain-containing protein [Actinoplanes sp. NPDC051343]|uniref:heme-degrading domain-containing protein n=1 Tax=Actinoplanes sp. NPDC051343 TaxID=3363906 RepID=UPI00379294AF
MTDDDLIARLEQQERDLIFTRFDFSDAWRLGSLLVEMAGERGLPVAIDIRRGTQQLFHAALAGSSADNDAWIERKVRVVQRFGHSSFLVGRRLAAQGRELDAGMGVNPARFAAHGGAFPVRVEAAGVIGVVTVSGLPQAEDHALVVEAIERFR